jgi:hypothetical protein
LRDRGASSLKLRITKGRLLTFLIAIGIGILTGALVWLQVQTGNISKLAEGVHAGFAVSLLTWVAFVFSLIAGLGLITLVALSRRPEPPSRIIARNKRLVVEIILGLAALIALAQFATPYPSYIELGILQGNVPSVLMGVAPALSFISTLGIIIYVWSAKAPSPVVGRNGGIESSERVDEVRTVIPVQAPSKVVTATSSAKPARTESSKQTPVGVILPSKGAETEASARTGQPGKLEPPPGVSAETLIRVGTIIAPHDPSILTNPTMPADGGSDRDAIQTKKNVSEWILLSLRIGGKVPKTKLETGFEDQFPRIYVPLFNSVLYDLIYQGKVEAVKEGNRMMISLAKGQENEKE